MANEFLQAALVDEGGMQLQCEVEVVRQAVQRDGRVLLRRAAEVTNQTGNPTWW